jgi:endonuclease/exonuclease/phosphatase family metal-dependent hydrolase
LSSLTLLLILGQPVFAQRLTIISWNLESGGSSDSFIANRVRTFQGVDLWGLSEVAGDGTASTFEVAAEDGENANFERVLSTTGSGDRLAIVFNATRFELINKMELHRVTFNADTPTPNSGQRSPLVVELRERTINKRFLFMVNHLARTNNDLRRDQAQRLNEWVRTQTVPVIAVGDYNFDWEVNGGDTNHDAGFDRMIADGAWVWARPATLIKSQCSPSFNSVLDFVFVNAAARAWQPVSVILQESGDCTIDNERPDHRPLKAEFDLSGSGLGVVTKADILRKIEDLERQLQELKGLAQRLP